jgi:hypothetical protein
MVVKSEAKSRDNDADTVWMANAEVNVRSWLTGFGDSEFKHWEEQDSARESWEKD